MVATSRASWALKPSVCNLCPGLSSLPLELCPVQRAEVTSNSSALKQLTRCQAYARALAAGYQDGKASLLGPM